MLLVHRSRRPGKVRPCDLVFFRLEQDPPGAWRTRGRVAGVRSYDCQERGTRRPTQMVNYMTCKAWSPHMAMYGLLVQGFSLRDEGRKWIGCRAPTILLGGGRCTAMHVCEGGSLAETRHERVCARKYPIHVHDRTLPIW